MFARTIEEARRATGRRFLTTADIGVSAISLAQLVRQGEAIGPLTFRGYAKMLGRLETMCFLLEIAEAGELFGGYALGITPGEFSPALPILVQMPPAANLEQRAEIGGVVISELVLEGEAGGEYLFKPRTPITTDREIAEFFEEITNLDGYGLTRSREFTTEFDVYASYLSARVFTLALGAFCEAEAQGKLGAPILFPLLGEIGEETEE